MCFARHGRKARVRDDANDLVTFVAPSKEPVGWAKDHDSEKDGYTAEKKQSIHILERPYSNGGINVKRKRFYRFALTGISSAQ